jgi:hypothetical protein
MGVREYLMVECVIPSRRRTAELTVTGGRWFLSVCYRKADTARPAPPAEV